jgi:hypothetical protein
LLTGELEAELEATKVEVHAAQADLDSLRSQAHDKDAAIREKEVLSTSVLCMLCDRENHVGMHGPLFVV